jgi:DNA-binding NarL/FixJ family response regulator
MIPIAIIQDSPGSVPPAREVLRASIDFCVTGIYYVPEEALKGLHENPPDIVILDLHHKQYGGIEWMKEIRNKIPCNKWLVHTLHDDDETIFNALRAGANGFVLKDALPEQLENALHELLRGGAPLSPRIMHKLLAYFHQQHPKENHPGMLSQREKEVMHFTARGLIYKEIACQLGIQTETVKKHLSRIYEKLHVQNKMEAVNKFYGL